MSKRSGELDGQRVPKVLASLIEGPHFLKAAAILAVLLLLTACGSGGSTTDPDGTGTTDSATTDTTDSPTTDSTSNAAPSASAQTVETSINTAVSFTLSASDSNGDSLSYTLYSNPSSGTLTGSAPSLTYTPDSGFLGGDSFQFYASDGLEDSTLATVSLSVEVDTNWNFGVSTLDSDSVTFYDTVSNAIDPGFTDAWMWLSSGLYSHYLSIILAPPYATGSVILPAPGWLQIVLSPNQGPGATLQVQGIPDHPLFGTNSSLLGGEVGIAHISYYDSNGNKGSASGSVTLSSLSMTFSGGEEGTISLTMDLDSLTLQTSAGSMTVTGSFSASGNNIVGGGDGSGAQITVWVSASAWTSPLSVLIDGSVKGNLTQYFAGTPPTCGSPSGKGHVTSQVTAGTHTVSAADAGSGSWGPTSVTVAENECLSVEVDEVGSTGGGNDGGGTGGTDCGLNPDDCGIFTDSHEPNNTSGQATNYPVPTGFGIFPTAAAISPAGDVDWYTFSLDTNLHNLPDAKDVYATTGVRVCISLYTSALTLFDTKCGVDPTIRPTFVTEGPFYVRIAAETSGNTGTYGFGVSNY